MHVVGPAALVDLDRYPILDLDQPGAPLAHPSGGPGTAYRAPRRRRPTRDGHPAYPNLDQPNGHPTRWIGDYGVGAVAYDLIPPASPLRLLYEWEPLMRFVEAALDRGLLFSYADPMGALNLAVMGAGDDFEVVPRIRSADTSATRPSPRCSPVTRAGSSGCR